MNAFEPSREKITVRVPDAAIVKELAAGLSIHPALASILANRGLRTIDACKKYFHPEIGHFHDPFNFESMDRAVARIESAIGAKEKIAVYGDYDVDGITSTALLLRVLGEIGARCTYYLPNRLTEGYGLSETGVRRIAASGATLMITVDCGITSLHEIALANDLGIDCIITDHHEPRQEFPQAYALLNPKIPGCAYPDKALAGVGVALKLCQALAMRVDKGEELWRPYLDLVALGTAADIVPLTGENRVICHLGFEMMPHTANTGLRALIREQKLDGKKLTTSQVVFQLAPCVNAVGRLGDPRKGVELLLTGDEATASLYAGELRETNLERRALDNAMAEDACAWVEQNCDPAQDFALVTSSPDWHVGVIGIVASKLVERYRRPSIVFSVGKDGLARGSGRSIPGVHLLDALNECAPLLETFGGHAAAAGMCVKSETIGAFRKKFNEVIRERITPEDLVPQVVADVDLTLDALTPSFYNVLKAMEPFGPGNMRPVLHCRGLKHRHAPRLVGSNHVKMTFTQGGVVMDGIAFNFGERLKELTNTDAVACAFSLDENEWNGRISLQMKVKGITV